MDAEALRGRGSGARAPALDHGEAGIPPRPGCACERTLPVFTRYIWT